LPVTYLLEERQGKNYAVQRALSIAKGAWLLFVDDDITPEPGWLKAYADAVKAWPNHVAFGGPVASRPPEGVDADLVAALPGILGVGHLDPDLGEREFPRNIRPLGANFLLRRSAFEQFHLTIDVGLGPKGVLRDVDGTETELFVQLAGAGEYPVFVPEARVVHRTDRAFWSLEVLERRAFAYGRGIIRSNAGLGDAVRILGIPWRLGPSIMGMLARRVWFRLLGDRTKTYRMRLALIVCVGVAFECRGGRVVGIWRVLRRFGWFPA
jgi:glycosyltransferase involved in cell wall biosynthesis